MAARVAYVVIPGQDFRAEVIDIASYRTVGDLKRRAAIWAGFPIEISSLFRVDIAVPSRNQDGRLEFPIDAFKEFLRISNEGGNLVAEPDESRLEAAIHADTVLLVSTFRPVDRVEVPAIVSRPTVWQQVWDILFGGGVGLREFLYTLLGGVALFGIQKLVG